MHYGKVTERSATSRSIKAQLHFPLGHVQFQATRLFAVARGIRLISGYGICPGFPLTPVRGLLAAMPTQPSTSFKRIYFGVVPVRS